MDKLNQKKILKKEIPEFLSTKHRAQSIAATRSQTSRMVFACKIQVLTSEPLNNQIKTGG
jgi:hypothetical protein